MRLAIMGAGNVGGALGAAWSRVGHAITYGVVVPDDPKHATAATAAGNARIATVAEAARAADAIVLAVHWPAVPEVLAACGDLAGRIIIDATNPLAYGPDGISLSLGFSTSGGEEVACLAPGAKVFKTMNQVGFQVMADAGGYPARPLMFVAGEDGAEKNQVLALVDSIGFDARDAGPLSSARLLEPHAMLWIDQAMRHGAPLDNAFAMLSRSPTR